MGEMDIGLGPAPPPVILGPVEAGGTQPVLHGEIEGVADAHAPLLGAVDEEQAAEGPEGLPADVLLALLVEEDHPLAGIGKFGGRDEAGEARPHDDDIGIHATSPLRGALVPGAPVPLSLRGRAAGCKPGRSRSLRRTSPSP